MKPPKRKTTGYRRAAAVAAVPRDTPFGVLNTAGPVLDVATDVLDARLAAAKGDGAAAVGKWRAAVEAQDKLRYDEPPDWIQPSRHALGAALLRSKQYKGAEKVFREDLSRLPDNGWGLFGLERSLRAQGKAEADQVKARFDTVWAKSDIAISSPCFCQPGE